MKKDHLAESTIKVTDRRLRLIAKTADLNNPDEVTEYLANKKGKNVDDLDLEKIAVMIQQANERSSKINVKRLLKKFKLFFFVRL